MASQTPIQSGSAATIDTRRHTPLGIGLLLGVYLGTVAAVATLAVGGAVYLTAVVSLPLAGLVAAWMLSVAGVALAPVAGRRALAAVSDRIGTGDQPLETGDETVRRGAPPRQPAD